MEFYLPMETGERLAFLAAALVGLFGLLAFCAPATALRLAGLAPQGGSREGLAFVRSAGGFKAGVCIAALLFAQDLIYLAIGGGLAFAACGRVLSLAADGSFSARNLARLAVEALLAGLMLAYPLGFL